MSLYSLTIVCVSVPNRTEVELVTVALRIKTPSLSALGPLSGFVQCRTN
jgi:hypothetical protein